MSKNDDEVLVRVEGVSKKFCRSLKKSLWYGVCDIASELNPFGRSTGQSIAYKNLTTIEHGGRCEKEHPKVGPKGESVATSESKDTERAAGGKQLADSAEFLEGHSQAGLQMDSEKLASIRSANAPSAFGEQTGSDSESVLIRDIRGKKSSSGLVTPEVSLRDGEFFAVKDVSFDVKRGELRTLGRSEKEILKKCLGATKVPDFWRRRYQMLGIIGRNGAGKSTLPRFGNSSTCQCRVIPRG